MDTQKTITLFDTTLRDGAQTRGVAFSLEDKIRIARHLDGLGIDFIEGGWPGSNPKDIAFFKEMQAHPLKQALLTAFSSTRGKNRAVEDDANIATLCATAAPAAAIFGKSWVLHVTDALETTLDENLRMIASTVAFLRPRFSRIVYDAEHYFDGFREDREYALASIEAAADAGADWIALCDTNGGAMPEFIAEATAAAIERVRIPVGIHAHNDSELAVANSLAAVEVGARMVQGTINGLGERCGNANLCSVIPNLELKRGLRCLPPGGLAQLAYTSRLVSEAINMSHPDWLPYVGRNAFAHKGGVHVSAVRKNSRCYEHVNPELVGNDRSITISELSGRYNVIEKARAMGFNLDGEPGRVAGILKEVKDLEARGYHFEGAEASFELLSARLLGVLKEYFTLQGFRVHTWADANGSLSSEATIKAKVPEEVSRSGGHAESIEHTSADGSGPVEAMDRALRKALEKFYPALVTVKLTDYKVRILNEDSGTAATTRVMITSSDGVDHWTTVGVSNNVLDASWRAMQDALIYKLRKDDVAAGKVSEREVVYAAHD
jgi:2-isopropylmalate synthase